MDTRLMQRMLAEAKAKQKKFEKELEKFNEEEFEYVYGANHVTILINGNLKVLNVKVNKDLLEDQEMLEELLAEAFSEAISEVNSKKEALEAKMNPGNGFM